MDMHKLFSAIVNAGYAMVILITVFGGFFLLWKAMGTILFLTMAGLFLALTAGYYWTDE